MASPSAAGPLDVQVLAALQEFCAQRYEASGARGFGIDEAAFVELLADVASQSSRTASEVEVRGFPTSLHVEELVLARACVNGSEFAWETFLLRYRVTLYESAYKIARETTAATWQIRSTLSSTALTRRARNAPSFVITRTRLTARLAADGCGAGVYQSLSQRQARH